MFHYKMIKGFRSRIRNHAVRTITRGSTKAQIRATMWAYQALTDAKAYDSYLAPIIQKGSTEGQFSFYHYCDDIVLSVRYDRKVGVWYAKVQRGIYALLPDLQGNHRSTYITFEIAIIAA